MGWDNRMDAEIRCMVKRRSWWGYRRGILHSVLSRVVIWWRYCWASWCTLWAHRHTGSRHVVLSCLCLVVISQFMMSFSLFLYFLFSILVASSQSILPYIQPWNCFDPAVTGSVRDPPNSFHPALIRLLCLYRVYVYKLSTPYLYTCTYPPNKLQLNHPSGSRSTACFP